jgi:hypothetical protein
MKTIVPLKGIFAALISLTAFALLSTDSIAAPPSSAGASAGVRDTMFIRKAQTNKKYKIRMYPNAENNVLFFSATGQNGKVYQLYLFDLDGHLAKQTHIKNKETTVLTNIVKGNYTFEVFSDDERIENGLLTIK